MSENQQPIDTSQANFMLPNRRLRRDQLRKNGILQIKNMFDYNTQAGSNYRQQQFEAGRKLMQQNQDRTEQQLADQNDERMSKIKQTWQDAGWSDKEIELTAQAWSLIDAKGQNYRQTTKQARQLLKEAEQLRKQRLGA